MDLSRVAARVAEQTLHALPITHDLMKPIMEDEKYEKDREKLFGVASEYIAQIQSYVEKVVDGLKADKSVPEDVVAQMDEKIVEFTHSIATSLLNQALDLTL